MSSAENKALVRRWYEEALNARNLAVADEILAPGFVINGETIGPEGMKQAALWVRSIFPDIQVEVEDVITEADMVVTRWTAHATHQGEFEGILPTGKPVTLTGIHIDRIAGGKIAERWENA